MRTINVLFNRAINVCPRRCRDFSNSKSAPSIDLQTMETLHCSCPGTKHVRFQHARRWRFVDGPPRGSGSQGSVTMELAKQDSDACRSSGRRAETRARLEGRKQRRWSSERAVAQSPPGVDINPHGLDRSGTAFPTRPLTLCAGRHLPLPRSFHPCIPSL